MRIYSTLLYNFAWYMLAKAKTGTFETIRIGDVAISCYKQFGLIIIDPETARPL